MLPLYLFKAFSGKGGGLCIPRLVRIQSIFELQCIPLRSYYRAFDHIFQLPDIAGPGIILEFGENMGGN